jgi:hypothetical protein
VLGHDPAITSGADPTCTIIVTTGIAGTPGTPAPMALPLGAAHAGGVADAWEDTITSGYLPSTIGAGDLVAELASMAADTGANTGLWPGLTIYRFTRRPGPARRAYQASARGSGGTGPGR